MERNGALAPIASQRREGHGEGVFRHIGGDVLEATVDTAVDVHQHLRGVLDAQGEGDVLAKPHGHLVDILYRYLRLDRRLRQRNRLFSGLFAGRIAVVGLERDGALAPVAPYRGEGHGKRRCVSGHVVDVAVDAAVNVHQNLGGVLRVDGEGDILAQLRRRFVHFERRFARNNHIRAVDVFEVIRHVRRRGGRRGFLGRHDSGFLGRDDSGLFGRDDSGFLGRHDSGLLGRHDNGFLGRHDNGFLSRLNSGFFGRHDCRFLGRLNNRLFRRDGRRRRGRHGLFRRSRKHQQGTGHFHAARENTGVTLILNALFRHRMHCIRRQIAICNASRLVIHADGNPFIQLTLLRTMRDIHHAGYTTNQLIARRIQVQLCAAERRGKAGVKELVIQHGAAVIYGCFVRDFGRFRYLGNIRRFGGSRCFRNIRRFGNIRCFGDFRCFGNIRRFGDFRYLRNTRRFGDFRCFGNIRHFRCFRRHDLNRFRRRSFRLFCSRRQHCSHTARHHEYSQQERQCLSHPLFVLHRPHSLFRAIFRHDVWLCQWQAIAVFHLSFRGEPQCSRWI